MGKMDPSIAADMSKASLKQGKPKDRSLSARGMLPIFGMKLSICKNTRLQAWIQFLTSSGDICYHQAGASPMSILS